MFRIVRVSATRLQGRYHGGSSRLYRTIRYYSKEQQQSELCPPPPPKKTHTGTALTFGGLALLGGAIIGYAKYDPDFRCHLVEYAPFTDDVIKFVFQEEKTYYYAITDLYRSWRDALFPGDEESDHKKKKKRKVAIQPTEEYKLDPREDVVLPETHPQNLADLEKSTTEAAKKAIELYTTAINAIRTYIAEIEVIIDDSTQSADQRVWETIKQKIDAKNDALKKAETEAKHAERDHRKLKSLLTTTEFNVKESIKQQAFRNIEELSANIETAKKSLQDEIQRSNITEKYWFKVREARRYFGDELAILFPNVDINEKKLSISEGDLDLFVLHAMAKVLYYQKELYKLETIGTERLNRAVEAAKKGGLEVLTTEQICHELEKEKRALEVEFQKKCLKLKEAGEKDLRRQLQMQSQAFADHLNDAIKLKEQEVEVKLTRDFDEKLLEEKCKHKEQLAAMVGRLRGLDQAIKETIGTERLNRAVEAAKKGGLEVLTTEQICHELEKEKRALEVEFQKKCLKLKEAGEKDLRRQLQLQSQAFADHLNDAIKLKEQEVEVKLTRDFDEKLLEEKCKHKEQLAAMVGRLRGLDQAIKERNNVDKDAHQAQVLWAACQSLYRAVKSGCPGFPWTEQLRPLDPEIKAVKLAADKNDELVNAVVAGIPPAAKNRGVYPEDALRERFLKVEEMARGLALVPEQGGRLHIYLLSYLQSFLLLRAANPIPQAELNDDETDFSKLTTNDILQRARYWIDRGDFSQTLKYMNLLQGAPRAIARQWMEEARIMLETQQAANTLMAHATASVISLITEQQKTFTESDIFDNGYVGHVLL
ncbi:Mitochondrial inner membrane protein [Popillia japonica]|uniref:MICOS complex subunit MIC60 n=1 Tax=Popillia japonica TaxID=7064 RepID=A0AAW1LSV8_POPJA